MSTDDNETMAAPADDFPPSEFFEMIGRIVVSASLLEGQLALSAALISGQPAPTPDPSNVLRDPDRFDDPTVHKALANPGQALKHFQKATARVVDAEVRASLEAVAADAKSLLNERNGVVHSVLRWRLPDGAYAGAMYLLRFHARGGTWSPLFTNEVADLDKRLLRLSHRVIQAGNSGHADWFHHRRGGTGVNDGRAEAP